QGVQAHRHEERQDRQIIRSDDLSHRSNHQFTLIPNRPKKASPEFLNDFLLQAAQSSTPPGKSHP
ncbi:hypothetical protein, partial [Gluconacetobacter entanii]|uniref:hypothetical protein n=1 Tax=Gluconacetobacter entanii TaxID=108528 RepID=UPI002235AAEF